MKQFLKRLFEIIFSIYGYIIFIILLLLIFPLVLIASLFGKVKGGNFIIKICYVAVSVLFFFWFMRYKQIGETAVVKNTPQVFVFNHCSYIDALIIFKTYKNVNFRALGKSEMAKIPIFGYLYSCLVVLVDRSSKESRSQSVTNLKNAVADGLSITVAPEGTFNTTDKPLLPFYDGAFRVSVDTQINVQPVLFLDCWSRLNHKSLFSLNPGKLRAVVLESVSYKNQSIESLKHEVYNIMDQKLIQYQAPWIGQEYYSSSTNSTSNGSKKANTSA